MRNETPHVRILSYSMNLLPRGSVGGAFQDERIATFLRHVQSENYDVVVLQEVFGAALFPHIAQKLVCFQRKIVDSLENIGFSFCALPRQPSYVSMLRYGMTTDTGLLILSKYPITCHGSFTFRSLKRNAQRALKGCLYAKIRMPSMDDTISDVVVFNAYLRSDSMQHQSVPARENSKILESIDQVDQLCTYIRSVLDQHSGTARYILAGNFDIDGIDSHGQSSSQLCDFMQQLQTSSSCSNVVDVLFEEYGRQFPTRPPRPFFQRGTDLCNTSVDPQRHDFVFLGSDERAWTYSSRLEKFHAPPLRPYVYLSDHFGVCVELKLLQRTEMVCMHSPVSNRDQSVKALFQFRSWSQQSPEKSPYSLWIVEAALILLVAWISLKILPLSEFLIPILILIFSAKRLLGNTVISEGLAAAMIASGTNKLEDTVKSSTASLVCSSDNTIVKSVWSLWESSLEKNRWQKCLGQRSLDAGIMFDPEWLSFSQVDAKIRDFGSGLLLGSVVRGETIAIMSGSSRRAIIADLACLAYGIITLSIAGSPSTIRQVLDARGVRVVICGRTSVNTLLECRSRTLRTIITFQPTEYDEETLAKDLNVELIKYETIEGRGRSSPCTPCPVQGSEAPYTLVVESAADITEFTQHDMLRGIESLERTGVLGTKGSNGVRDLYVWHAPFSSLLHRLFALCMIFNGDCVACAERIKLQDALRYFQPTILVALPPLFQASEQQFRDNLRKSSRIYRSLLTAVYKFRSQLIHERHRDSSTLRKLFFRPFQKQIGGKVRKIIIGASDSSISFSVHEFIAVCYTPCIREVFFNHQSGVIAVDGTPGPFVSVELSSESSTTHSPRVDGSIGKLCVALHSLYPPCLRGQWKSYEIAAAWTLNENNSSHQLRLLGPADAILWPVDYLHASAQDLEREFAQCRYVFDIFITCERGKPLVAVVHPNKELIEWEWSHRYPHMSTRQLSWVELISFATPLMLDDFAKIGDERSIHTSQRISAVHMHPHAFSEHSDFLTPHGKMRRWRLTEYFSRHVQRLYGTDRIERYHSASPTTQETASHFPCLQAISPMESFEDNSTLADEGLRTATPILRPIGRQRFELKVPVAVDIGGTFAKVVYLRPPGGVGLPSFVHREYNSLERSVFPDLKFFNDHSLIEGESENYVGELCFAKLESKLVPQFVQYLQDNNTVSLYKEEYMVNVRATGGGAFKYASLVQNLLGVRLKVVKEMDSIVWGINLLLRVAPETIFSVDPDTGAPVPHRLSGTNPTNEGEDPFPFLVVNIGSGISIVKCIRNDGSYERVGGSAIGGATFWGLVRTMTNIQSWDEVLEITRVDGPGDNTNVDLLVGDIYGFNATDLPNMLSVDTVASTFGKLGTDRFQRSVHVRRPSLALSDDDGVLPFEAGAAADTQSAGLFPVVDMHSMDSHSAPSTVAGAPTGMRRAGSGASMQGGGITQQSTLMPSHKPNVSAIDVVRSLLIMIANNVTQLAYLHCRSENAKHVFFTGGFVRDNPIVWRQIAKSMKYWSKAQLDAHFIAHDGYLGALGTATVDLGEASTA